MSIVAVHGPNMWGGSGAGGGGTGPTITTAGGSVTANQANGMQFTLTGVGDRATYAWTFSDGTAAVNTKTGTVTFTAPGAKTITETVSGAGTTPTGGPFTYNVTADTASTAQVVDNPGGTVTADQYNGLLFSFAGKGDRNAADYDWTFTGGAGAAAQPNVKTGTVTFTDAGQKTITLTLGTSGGTTPPGGPYTFQVTATTGAVPRSIMQPPEEEEVVNGNGNGDVFDPAEYTIDEVKAFVEANPETVEDMLAAEEAGKNRVTLITWLEEFEA